MANFLVFTKHILSTWYLEKQRYMPQFLFLNRSLCRRADKRICKIEMIAVNLIW